MGQLLYLFEHSQNKETQVLKYQAGIHGIKVDENNMRKKESDGSGKQEFMFRDPKEYENLSQEEKDQQTKQMMGHFSRFAADPIKFVRKKG